MMGGRGGWLGFEVGDDTGGGEVAGDEAADMTVDMLDERWVRMFGYVACDVAEAIAPEKSQCFEGFPVIDSCAAKDDVSILKRRVRRRRILRLEGSISNRCSTDGRSIISKRQRPF